MGDTQTIANWELQGITLKRVASTNGGEYVSPCPDCEGDDRFLVWPHQGPNGRFWCRQCGKKGDLIEFLRWQKGMSFKEACDAIGKTLPQRRKVFTDTSWWKNPKTPNESQFKPQPQDAEHLNQKFDEAIKPKKEEQKQQTTVETQAKPKHLPSPRMFLKKCSNCENFDIEDGIAWCFNAASYRNHQFLKSCPVYNV
jgi:hypothetical protein